MDSEDSKKKYIEKIIIFGNIEAEDPFSYGFSPEFSSINDRILMIVGIYKELRKSELKVEIDGYSARTGSSGSVAVKCGLPLPFDKHYHDCYEEFKKHEREHDGYEARKRYMLHHGGEIPKKISKETVEQSRDKVMRIMGERFESRQKSLIKEVTELFPSIQLYTSRDVSWSRELGIIIGKHQIPGQQYLCDTERLELDYKLEELIEKYKSEN